MEKLASYEAIMKPDIPYCGFEEIKDGVTTTMLRRNGIWVITDKER